MAATVFVDTSYFVALLDPRDDAYHAAVELAKKLAARRAHLLTTDGVLMELANYFSRGPLRRHAIDLVAATRADEGWTVVPIDRPSLLRAEARYRAHADKSWSVTDCMSMDVMSTRRVREIATLDSGFTQAGFRVLLRT